MKAEKKDNRRDDCVVAMKEKQRADLKAALMAAKLVSWKDNLRDVEKVVL